MMIPVTKLQYPLRPKRKFRMCRICHSIHPRSKYFRFIIMRTMLTTEGRGEQSKTGWHASEAPCAASQDGSGTAR